MRNRMSCLFLALLVMLFAGCKERWVNQPPHPPDNPSPANGAEGIQPDADLAWRGGDPDLKSKVKYDVYFGMTSPPLLVCSDQSDTIYDPGPLTGSATYYWRIVAKDDSGVTASSPVWSFAVYGRHVNPWIDGRWVVSASSHKRALTYMSQGDSLRIQASLVQGDYIASMFCCTNLEYYKWRSNVSIEPLWQVNNSRGGSWAAYCPSGDSLAFVVRNDARLATIKVDVKIDRIRWY